MKKVSILILMWLLVGLLVIGCDDDNNGIMNPVPAAPQGVITITGNNQVYVWWDGPFESDIEKYVIYRSLDDDQHFEALVTVPAQPNPDLALIPYEYIDQSAQNGNTYFYAVQSIDRAGQGSNLSVPTFDTPRPEGEMSIFPNNTEPTLAGFNFETGQLVAWDSPAADIFVDIFEGTPYVNVGVQGTVLQDMGWTGDFADIGYGTTEGWSALGFSELILDHTYMVVTVENNWAKVRFTMENPSGSYRMQWAYQTVSGNLELAPPIIHEGDGAIRTKSGLTVK
jgi:hypothetical protein